MSTISAEATKSSGLFSTAMLQKVLPFAVLVCLFTFFCVFANHFAQTDNFIDIMVATYVNGVLACACTFVIISGGIDLSVGTLMTFTAVMSGIFITNLGLPMLVGVVGALLAGAAAGALSGTVIAKMKLPPFIATLGMMQLARGSSLLIAHEHPIYFTETPSYAYIAQESTITKLIPGLEIPNGVFLMFIVAIVSAFVLNRTLFGRYVFALGSNEEAARLSGMNVDFWKICTYAFSGLVCGVAGLLISSRLSQARPDLGFGYELEAIAATVIGGTSLSGGRGSILGSIIGAFILSVLLNGLRIMGAEEDWKIVVTGIVIILAVYVDTLLRKKA
ncbi:MAG: ABC transporter permease [Alphaproteobacteria bacterium]|nr:ABC transporter permease [Alphaproteobacteria bacterium]